MRHGPVDVLILAYGQPQFDGSVAEELQRLAQQGIIRVADAMFVVKDENGRGATLDFEDLPPDLRSAFGFIETGTKGLFDSQDADPIMEGMLPGTAVIALAIEHAWAARLVQALEQTGAQLAMDVRIPAAEVEEAYAALV